MIHRCLNAFALATALTLGICGGADAALYKQVNATASQISFTYNQMGSSAYGHFSQFQATLDFDTANPAAGSAGINIQLDSIDVGNSDTSSQLQEPGWFNTAQYPMATFESTRIQPLGDNHYEVTGRLSLKGQTHEVTAQVNLKPDNGIGIFYGELTLKRSDFKVGEGEWADHGIVSNDIDIKFRIVAPEQSNH
jgi:polyisoprenoid-binding protein YceI